MPSALVYRIANTVNSKLYYGITMCSLAKRWREHLCAARTSGALLYRAMRRHGVAAFRIEMVYEAVDLREALAVERGLIAAYGTYGGTRGYNASSGGEGPNGALRPGELCGHAILSEEIVAFTRNPALLGMVNRELRSLIGRRFGAFVSRDAVRDARCGKSWRHLNAKYPPIKRPHEKLSHKTARLIFLDRRFHRAIARDHAVDDETVRNIKRRRTYLAATEGLC